MIQLISKWVSIIMLFVFTAIGVMLLMGFTIEEIVPFDLGEKLPVVLTSVALILVWQGVAFRIYKFWRDYRKHRACMNLS